MPIKTKAFILLQHHHSNYNLMQKRHNLLNVFFFLLLPFLGHAQSLVKGSVYNANNEKPIPGVTISIKPVQKKLVTEEGGIFQTKLHTGRYKFIFSKPQFQSKNLTVYVKKNQPITELGTIYLEPVAESLQPVVISNITDFVSDKKKADVSRQYQ